VVEDCGNGSSWSQTMKIFLLGVKKG